MLAPGGNGRAAAAAGAHEGRIEFENVWFAYQGDDWVLQDVSFAIAPGERVALVGATGSGKTTLTNLLLRFYDVRRGVIRVDGRPLDAWPRAALRRRIGLVLQDPFLFSGTIESNLGLGEPGLTPAALERAAREVGAHEFIERLPGGYAGEVRERGATLSAGQRQLLAFARTLARDPRLLVLDEATSSVDTRTELLIQAALKRLMAATTAGSARSEPTPSCWRSGASTHASTSSRCWAAGRGTRAHRRTASPAWTTRPPAPSRRPLPHRSLTAPPGSFSII